MDCDIYAGIFGEVDLEQACGVVQELVNIVGGIVKPKIKDQKSIIGIDHPGNGNSANAKNWLALELGLPTGSMGENQTFEMDPQIPKFIIPFKARMRNSSSWYFSRRVKNAYCRKSFARLKSPIKGIFDPKVVEVLIKLFEV